MTTILAFIFVIGILVFIHELGHYLAARSVGIRVERFSVGFPPRLFSFVSKNGGWLIKLFFLKKTKEGSWAWGTVWEKLFTKKSKKGTSTEYCIALIPLGGYVKMAGIIDESMDEKITNAPDEFMSKSYLSQIFVMSAGVIMNVLLAFIIYTGLNYFYGKPIDGQFPLGAVMGEIVDNSPAQKAGILPGDKIISINDKKVEYWKDIVKIINSESVDKISIVLDRDSEILIKDLVPVSSLDIAISGQDNKRYIGVSPPKIQYEDIGILESSKLGYTDTINGFGLIVLSLKMLFSGEASINELGGPIMIAQLAGETARAGWTPLLSFMALISINLAFLNILPIPGLDGGHIFFTLIQAIIGRPLDIKIKMVIQQIGMILLLFLMLTAMYNDLVRFFTN